MRKAQKKQAEAFIKLLEEAHDEAAAALRKGKRETAGQILADCQAGAVSLGEMVEATEGEGTNTVSLLEEYCEMLYEAHGEAAGGGGNPGGMIRRLRRQLVRVGNSIKNDIPVRYEIVFMPYKASMWDSLESVWQAAQADPDCDAYVVPLPYYERKADGSPGALHYEGDLFPEGAEVTHYRAYKLEERKPDAIYIHNPYDDVNIVTSVYPEFYSRELKQHTQCLVYIPYYATAGGMSEAQAMCPAYLHADYIVIQAGQYRKFFDKGIPDEKFLALGSPKFDSVIHRCQNPPEPPKGWAEKMEGRKVYFYNTSLGGMLGNTEAFLKKMEYVFSVFRGREDACLLWRPHPLLESTFASMRQEYKPWFDRLKEGYIREGWGIYDDTPDIENTIALSDVYIGDSGTSVTSLFGVAGKPLFILNNLIHSLPGEDDWRGERLANVSFDMWGNDRYQVTANNQLWFSENNDYHYKFYMDLGSGYSAGGYYLGTVEIRNKIYVIPRNARHILIIQDKNIRKIKLKIQELQGNVFLCYWYNEKYIFIFPCQYDYLIRFTIGTEKVEYIEGIKQFYLRKVNGELRCGGTGVYKNELIFASPEDNNFIFMDIDTLNRKMICSHSQCNLGTQTIITDEDKLWLLPLNGMIITCWNPETGELREYNGVPDTFKAIRWPYEIVCNERPFGNIAIYKKNGKKNIILSPGWGNMYISLDCESGEMKEWKSPVGNTNRGKNGYFAIGGMGGFVITIPQVGKEECRIWYAPERRLYDINVDTKEYKEVEIDFDLNDLRKHEPGFMEESEWLQYCLSENAFNSLKDLLDWNITGHCFDSKRQLKAFEKINANTEGTCGQNIYNLIKKKTDSIK